MHYGLAIPDMVGAQELIDLAREAEEAGWDGFFYWDGGRIDPWVALSAVAARTERLRLGTMVTPLPRQQPWRVAGETATLDQLSGGRVVLPVGLGVIDFENMGFPKDYKIRARMLDEGLEVIERWWSGQEFSFEGQQYQLQSVTGLRPVQEPRIPVWVIGGDKQSQLKRCARWDGAMIQGTPEVIRARKAAIEQLRATTAALDIITEGQTPGDDPRQAAAIVQSFAEVGLTWWNEAVWNIPYKEGGVEGIRRRIQQGPPRIE